MHHSPRHERLPLLAAIATLGLGGAAVVAVLVVGLRSGAELREEGAEAILLAEMEAELQTTAAHADALAAGMPASTDDTRVQPVDPPDLVASIAGFSAAAAELQPLLDEGNTMRLSELMASHERYAESVSELYSLEASGGDVMIVYHEETEGFEAEVREDLLGMRRHESEEIYASIDRSTNAETVMLWLVPALFTLALSIAVYALRLQDNRRKQTITMLQRGNAEKDRFLATVSHELRTPLTSVLGFIDILEDDSKQHSPEARREMLHLASREATELSNLVEDLLVIARADSGALSTTDVSVDLKAQVAQVLEAMDGASEVALEIKGLTVGRGDPARTRQIIRNLLTNAFRYGGSEVLIHIRSDDQAARLQVRDNGAGVPEDQRELIFKPYHRAGPGRDPVGSVGLGLAVSRQLARAMGGDLIYRYKSGHSVFEFSIPRATSPSPAAEPQLSSSRA